MRVSGAGYLRRWPWHPVRHPGGFAALRGQISFPAIESRTARPQAPTCVGYHRKVANGGRLSVWPSRFAAAESRTASPQARSGPGSADQAETARPRSGQADCRCDDRGEDLRLLRATDRGARQGAEAVGIGCDNIDEYHDPNSVF